MANVAVRLPVGQHLAHDSSLTTVVPTLPVDFALPLWYSFAGFLLLYIALLTLRVRIEEQRAMLDRLYLESDE